MLIIPLLSYSITFYHAVWHWFGEICLTFLTLNVFDNVRDQSFDNFLTVYSQAGHWNEWVIHAFLLYEFLLIKVILLLSLSSNRPQDCGNEHSIKTCTDEQDNAQVGKKNCTNQQLWYDITLIFNYVQDFNMVCDNELLFFNLPYIIIITTTSLFTTTNFFIF